MAMNRSQVLRNISSSKDQGLENTSWGPATTILRTAY